MPPESDQDSIVAFARDSAAILRDLDQIIVDDYSDFTIMNGYYTYLIGDSGITRGNIEYPVFQNGRCVFFVSAVYEEGEWLYTCSTGYALQYDSLKEGNGFIAYISEEPYWVTSDYCTNLISGSSRANNENWSLGQDAVLITIEKGIGSFRLPANALLRQEGDGPTRVWGFDIYQTDYKVLAMANCLVNQYVLENGVLVKHGMCWASAICGLIRYKLQNFNIYPEVICQLMGVGLDQGILWAHKAYDAVDYYGATTGGYQDLTRKANSQTEIRHNLNNRFPIYMGGLALNLTGHAVLMIGYQYVSASDTFYMIYWDSNDEQIKTSVFGTGSKVFVSGGTTYYWNCSVLIPLP